MAGQLDVHFTGAEGLGRSWVYVKKKKKKKRRAYLRPGSRGSRQEQYLLMVFFFYLVVAVQFLVCGSGRSKEDDGSSPNL